MKTTIEIPDGLYDRCKELIRKEHTSLRALVEEGLTIAVERHGRPTHFEFSPVTFGGGGVREEFRNAGWDAIAGISERHWGKMYLPCSVSPTNSLDL